MAEIDTNIDMSIEYNLDSLQADLASVNRIISDTLNLFTSKYKCKATVEITETAMQTKCGELIVYSAKTTAHLQ